MSSDTSRRRWEKAQRIFLEVVDLPSDERAPLLREQCGKDEALHREVESLLAAHDDAGDILADVDRLLVETADAREGEGGALRQPRADPYGILGSLQGRYRIEKFIGAGGMGVVYRARDETLGRSVALKFLPRELASGPEERARFLREARAASKLDHPNICTIYEVGETEHRQLFLAMSYYDGETLKQAIARGPLEQRLAAKYAAQVARGLAASHAAGIVHRDIKPANVMIARPGPGGVEPVAKILDFGLAKIFELGVLQEVDQDLTRTGVVRGTAEYMSPEQARGQKVDHRTDIWSLGVVLFEMLTGRRPFSRPNDRATIDAIVRQTVPSLREPTGDIHADMGHVVATCLEKDRRRRYQSAGELAGDLERLLAPTASATSARLRRRRLRWLGRRASPWVVVGGVIGIVAALGLGVQTLWEARSPAAARIEVAVLPFEHLGSDPADQPFVDGLVHVAANTLTDLDRFTGRLSVVPPRDVLLAEVNTAAAAADRFGVGVAIGGTVQGSPDLVFVDLTLIDASLGRQRSTRSIRVARRDLAALKDSLLTGLADLLSISLDDSATRSLAAGDTEEPRAYALYTEALGYLSRYESEVNIDSGIRLLEEALAVDPGYTIATAALGEAYLRKYTQGQSRDQELIESARAYSLAALDADSLLPAAHSTLGDVHLWTGAYEDATVAYRRALELHPGDAFTHRALAIALQNQGDLEAAEGSIEKAIELRPNYWDFHRALGYLLHVQGRHGEATTPYRRVVELQPDNPSGYNDLGAQYERLGRYAEARTWYAQGARANPEATRATAFAYGNWAGIHFREGDFGEAVRLFELSRRADSTTVRAWANLPASYYWNGQSDRAQETWQDVIRIEEQRIQVNPSDVSSLARLADALAKTGQGPAAQGILERGVPLTQDPWVLLGMALTYEYLGERTRALETLERSLAGGLTQASLDFQKPWMDNLATDHRYQELMGRYLGST